MRLGDPQGMNHGVSVAAMKVYASLGFGGVEVAALHGMT